MGYKLEQYLGHRYDVILKGNIAQMKYVGEWKVKS